MDPTPIRSFRSLWHAGSNTGRVVLQLEDAGTVAIKVDSAGELLAMTAMLRENQCYWDAGEELLLTAWRAPGR
jgi:hypothetical protein